MSDHLSLESEKDLEEFREFDGLICPKCGNREGINLESPQTDGELVYEDRYCPNCQMRFRVFYRIDD